MKLHGEHPDDAKDGVPELLAKVLSAPTRGTLRVVRYLGRGVSLAIVSLTWLLLVASYWRAHVHLHQPTWHLVLVAMLAFMLFDLATLAIVHATKEVDDDP